MTQTPLQIIEEFNDTHRIKDVIEQVTGTNIKGTSMPCPIHGGDNKNGSSINIAKNIFTCWTSNCGRGLTPWNFIAKYYNLNDFKEIAKKINAIFNMNIPIYSKNENSTNNKKYFIKPSVEFNVTLKNNEKYISGINQNVIYDAIREYKHIVLQAPTGTGKTYSITTLAEIMQDKYNLDYVFFLAPTRGSVRKMRIYNVKSIFLTLPRIEEMKKLLISRNIGYDFTKKKSSIPRMRVSKLKQLYKATTITNNLGDISILEYDNIPDFDLFNFSFPCTDLSVAGKQKGFANEDGTHTRSGLVKFGIDLIKNKKPKYIMMENVKALIQKKFINDFDSIISELENIGYNCYYPKNEKGKPKTLNSKDFGIPQNRERIFVVGIRKDINNSTFNFPVGFELTKRLKDILEDNIEEKYFLSEDIVKRFVQSNLNDGTHSIVGSAKPSFRKIGQKDLVYGSESYIGTLTATDYKQPKQVMLKVDRIGGCFDTEESKHQAGSVYNVNGLAPTLDSMQGGYRQPCVIDSKYFLNKTKDFLLKIL